MNIMLFLADIAHRGESGKLNVLGAGWTKTGTPLSAHSVILLIDADDDELGVAHQLRLQLVDSSDEPVKDPGGAALDVEIGFTPGLEEGMTVTSLTSIAVNLAEGLPLTPGVHTWKVTSASCPDKAWKRMFEVANTTVEATPKLRSKKIKK